MRLEKIDRQLRDECKSVGLQHADVVIGLSDGGNGLENCLMNVVSGMAKEIVFILDYWHASEDLQEFANIFIADEVARTKQVELWCNHLKEHGGAVAGPATGSHRHDGSFAPSDRTVSITEELPAVKSASHGLP